MSTYKAAQAEYRRSRWDCHRCHCDRTALRHTKSFDAAGNSRSDRSHQPDRARLKGRKCTARSRWQSPRFSSRRSRRRANRCCHEQQWRLASGCRNGFVLTLLSETNMSGTDNISVPPTVPPDRFATDVFDWWTRSARPFCGILSGTRNTARCQLCDPLESP